MKKLIAAASIGSVAMLLMVFVWVSWHHPVRPFTNTSCPWRASTSGFGGDRCW